MTTTYLAVTRRVGDYGYEDTDLPEYGGMVLEDSEGVWVADLHPKDNYLTAVEAEVARALGVDVARVTVTPTGANVNGDTSHRNVFASATDWEVEVR